MPKQNSSAASLTLLAAPAPLAPADRAPTPLQVAVTEQLFGHMGPAAAAPAVFLIAHTEFDAAALRSAAQVYRRERSRSAEVLAGALLEEAVSRGAKAPAAPVAAEDPRIVAQPAPDLDIRSPRGAMIAELQRRYAGELPLEWDRIADYVFAREESLLARLTLALDHLRATAQPGGAADAVLLAIREVQHLARENYRLGQGLPL